MRNAEKSELIQNLVKNFSKLERRQRHFMKDALKSAGLQGVMYKYIITIKINPGTNQDYLAEFHSVDKSRVARIVRELEKMGYLSRSPNEKDRRSHQLFLTPEGERLYIIIKQKLLDWGTIISSSISSDDISFTSSTIDTMITNASNI